MPIIGCHFEFLLMNRAKPIFTHYSCNQRPRNFTFCFLNLFQNSGTSVCIAAVLPNSLYFLRQYFPPLDTFCRFTRIPVIKCIEANLEIITHRLNSKFFLMRLYERIFFLSLEQKMLMAFFKMSRPMRASANSFRSLEISFSASVCIFLPFPGNAISLWFLY